MNHVEELCLEDRFDLDEIESLPAFNVPTFFTFTEAETFDSTLCTCAITVVNEIPYNGVLCYALSPFGLCEDSVTYEFVSQSEHGRWYRFLHQPSDTIYVTSSEDILRDIQNRGPNSLNRVNISAHGAGPDVVPLGDIAFRAFQASWANRQSASGRAGANEYQQARGVLEAIAGRLSADGTLNIVVCGAGSAELDSQLQDIVGENRTVRTWDNVVTFFGGAPVVSPVKILSGYKGRR